MRRALATAAVVAGLGLAATACGGSHPAALPAGPSFGPLPSWLPTQAPVHQVEVATVSKPVYASQGDTVDVHLGSGTARMTVVGPATPGQGLDPEPNATYCTFTVTVAGETGSVPLRLADFSAIDGVGALYSLTPTQGEHAPPATVSAGQHVTFQMRTVMRTGEGLLHWEPGGRLSPVAWDFTVEVD